MLKVSLYIIPSHIEKCCMILLINEELGARFLLINIEEFVLMSFNEIDLFIGPKFCQLTSLRIKNQINKIARCHLNKLERHHRRSEIEHNFIIRVVLSLNSRYTLH